MSAENPRRIGQFFALVSSGIVLLAMSVFWLVTNYHTENILRQQADSLGDTLARQTAILTTELVLSNDLISMNVLLNQLTRDAAVLQAAVLTVDDQVLAISGNSLGGANGVEGSQVFRSYVAPIALQGSLAGYVRINLDESHIERGVTRNFNFLLLALLLLLVMTVAVTYALARHYISDPLQMLESCLQEMRKGTIELSPYADREDEVGAVIRQYNALAHERARGPED
ncbi:MAG: AhpA/YtjB family protein [Pseudomonadales bacterium]|nr:AhpA/YtjB family protein [Pseudomonadales bacterium]